MSEVMYDQSSVLIISVLCLSLLLIIEIGYRIGSVFKGRATNANRSQIVAIQGSLLGILALMLGFTFSLSLQRYDGRSAAVVHEANAIGTTYLRAKLLPTSFRSEARKGVREYVDLRVAASTFSLADDHKRRELLQKSDAKFADLWDLAARAVEEDPNPVRTGMFVSALNEMTDSLNSRNSALERHVPEIVLFLLYGTFLMTGCIVGFASGLSGHRTSFATYIMVGLIVLLVFIIIDLDRPRRGLIEVSQNSMLELQRSMAGDSD